MFVAKTRTHPLFKALDIVILVVFAALQTPRPAAAQEAAKEGGEQISGEQYERLETVRELMAAGESAEAIGQLESIIHDYTDSDAVLREAYHYIVRIYLDQNDRSMAISRAREALTRFPDLTANVLTHPPAINHLYDELRNEMFGSLVITEPDGADIYLKKVGEEAEVNYGKAPQTLSLIAVGDYDLRFAKSGFVDYVERITVQPGRTDISRSMKKKKGPWWWISRVGAGAVAVGGLVWALVGGSDGGGQTPPPEPLPDPPAPPAN